MNSDIFVIGFALKTEEWQLQNLSLSIASLFFEVFEFSNLLEWRNDFITWPCYYASIHNRRIYQIVNSQ